MVICGELAAEPERKGRNLVDRASDLLNLISSPICVTGSSA